jgi:hypothetical protein
LVNKQIREFLGGNIADDQISKFDESFISLLRELDEFENSTLDVSDDISIEGGDEDDQSDEKSNTNIENSTIDESELFTLKKELIDVIGGDDELENLDDFCI